MNKGFTLIEILVVVGILTVLFAVVLIAINPERQLNLATDSRRKSDLEQIHKSLMQYYVTNQKFPTQQLWYQVASSPENIPEFYRSYLAKLPTDPDPNQRYYYHPLDADCEPCVLDYITCTGFRMLARLKNKDDRAIKNAGCDGPMGCGITEWDTVVPNYGVSSGCSVKVE